MRIAERLACRTHRGSRVWDKEAHVNECDLPIACGRYVLMSYIVAQYDIQYLARIPTLITASMCPHDASALFAAQQRTLTMTGHGHAHGACGHEHAEHGGHEHDHGQDEGGEAWALYEKIDTDRLLCLNEKRRDSLKDVLRPWHQRLDTTLPTLESDMDEQLLMCIPFVSPVKIKSIAILGAGDEGNPAVMSAYVNQETMDFSSTESTRPVQTWELTRRVGDGLMEYPTRFTKFQVGCASSTRARACTDSK